MEDVVKELIQLNSRLHESGVTTGWLIFIAVLFGITLVLSARELLLWFFKVHHLHSELDEMKATLARIEARVNKPESNVTSIEAPVVKIPDHVPDAVVVAATVDRSVKRSVEPSAEPTAKPKNKSFTLNH